MSEYSPYYLNVVAGNALSGAEVVHKFGHNIAVGTSYVPIAHGGVWRTPQVAGATKLRIKAGNTNDTAAGTGARAVRIQGINTLGEEVTEDLVTAGTSASANSINDYIRLYRAFVCESGTYGTTAVGSHAADIIIENAAGTEDWAELDVNTYPSSQTDIGMYTVPKGKTAYLLNMKYSVDTAFVSSLFFFRRENILDTSAPYEAVRKQFGVDAVIRDGASVFDIPLGPFPEYTDIGFLGKVNMTTATLSVEFDLLVRDKE